MNKKKKQPGNFKRKATALSILAAILLFAYLKMYQAFSVDLLMKEIHDLEQQRRALLSQSEQLQAEVDRLKNINRITRLAKERRNLVTNTDKVFYLALDDYQKLKKIKNRFAQRNEQKRRELNLAGVQTSK